MCSYFMAVSQSCSQRKPKGYVIKELSCSQVKLWWSSIWHHCVLEVTCEGPCKQWSNIESNVRATLLELQNRDRVSLGQKIEQGVLLLQAPEIMSDTLRQMSVNTRYVHMLNLPWLCKCKSNNQPADGCSSPLCATLCSGSPHFTWVLWCRLTL